MGAEWRMDYQLGLQLNWCCILSLGDGHFLLDGCLVVELLGRYACLDACLPLAQLNFH
jgi:hypothetical protein